MSRAEIILIELKSRGRSGVLLVLEYYLLLLLFGKLSYGCTLTVLKQSINSNL